MIISVLLALWIQIGSVGEIYASVSIRGGELKT